MARIDLNQDNGWIAEEKDSAVVREAVKQSAVEANARRVPMTSDLIAVPRFLGDEPDVVAEAALIPEADVTLDDVELRAVKFEKIYRYSEEDVSDTFVDLLNESKINWASSYMKKFDNACLGTTAVKNNLTVPFNSVYHEVSQASDAATRKIATAGVLKLTHLNSGLGVIEGGDYWDDEDMIVIAHPNLRTSLREMQDSAGNLVQQYQDPLGRTRENLFGYNLVWSYGARTSAVATAKPTGNPLVIFGNRKLLLNGVRSGPESKLSDEAEFRTDELLLKVRARRGFAVARAEAFSVVEVTPSA